MMNDKVPDKVYLSKYFARYYKSPTVNKNKKFHNDIEYVLKSTADEKFKAICKIADERGKLRNTLEKRTRKQRRDIAKLDSRLKNNISEREEILKPIRKAMQAWDDYQSGKLDYLDSSTPWKACKETLELAYNKGL